MYLCLTISLWITLPLSVLAAGFLVRIFIIQTIVVTGMNGA